MGGSATWTAGSYTDTGTITLEASSGGYSRVDLELAGGSRVSVRAPLGSRASSHGSLPGGAAQATGSLAAGSADSGGAAHQLPPGAVWTRAAWFFPALVLDAAGSPAVGLSDSGQTTINGAMADHLRLALTAPRPTPHMAAEIASLSQADYYLNPPTHLPVALDFVEHPAGVVNRGGVRVEIRYGDWQQNLGIEVPHHFER